MIRSRPKNTTLFSLSLFLIIAYGLGIWAWISLPHPAGMRILLPVIILLVALLVTIKVVSGYRTLEIDGDRWRVKRLINRSIKFTGRDIEWWKEIKISTAGSTYKQLQVYAGKGSTAKVSMQEHTGYEKVLKRLKTKHGAIEIKETP